MRHEDRDRVIDEFRKGITKILIATDVLSRGFDQSTVTLVVNYDMPTTKDGQPAFETYVADAFSPAHTPRSHRPTAAASAPSTSLTTPPQWDTDCTTRALIPVTGNTVRSFYCYARTTVRSPRKLNHGLTL
jgi:hypothetical protein